MSGRLPSLTPRQVIRALQRGGFSVTNTTGSHYRLVHKENPSRWVIVAYHNKDLKRGTLTGIIRQAGFTIDQFIALL
jgi:predicted RNA binding protein YcfA (HicA-like mRNA interferase family)